MLTTTPTSDKDDDGPSSKKQKTTGEAAPVGVRERGIGLDHFAAIVLEGDGNYEVLQIGEGGSFVTGDSKDGGVAFTADRTAGEPGVWLYDTVEEEEETEEGVEGGAASGKRWVVNRRALPPKGPLKDLIQENSEASSSSSSSSSAGGGSVLADPSDDPRLAAIRGRNPAESTAMW